jgi:peptide deformylase
MYLNHIPDGIGAVHNMGRRSCEAIVSTPPALYQAAKTAYILDMAILKIARMGHPILAAPAAAIGNPAAPEIRALIADMVETLRDAGGVGLAAPQIHVPSRVVIFEVPAERSGEEAVPLTVLINPEIEALSDEKALGWEACLSLPGMMGAVPRFTHIRYRGLDLDGGTVEREARDYHARVVQHEMRLFGFVEEMHKKVGSDDDDDDGDEEAAA